jgi:hypothetical protein
MSWQHFPRAVGADLDYVVTVEKGTARCRIPSRIEKFRDCFVRSIGK